MKPAANPPEAAGAALPPEALAEISAAALAAGHGFGAELAARGLPALPDDPMIDRRPLVFQHLPKTGGASMIHVLETYFDDAEICHAFNPADFSTLTPDPALKFHRGHLLACQIAHFAPGADVFTVLRHPVDYALSMYRFALRLDDDAYSAMWAEAPHAAGARGDDATYAGFSAAGIAAVQRAMLIELIRSPEPAARALFWHPFVRALATMAPASNPETPDELAVALGEIEARLEEYSISATQNVRGMLVVGDLARVDAALLTLCARRGWPAPPPIPQIHRYEDDRGQNAPREALEAALRRHSPCEFPLYERADARARADEEALVAAHGSLASARRGIDAAYAARFFRTAPRGYGFDREAASVWAGLGWGLRERHETRLSRGFSDGRSASLLARLLPGSHYILIAEVYSAPDAADVAGLQASAGGAMLERTGEYWTESGTYKVVFDIPAGLVAAFDGDVVLTLHARAGHPAPEMRFARVTCQPRHYL